MSRLRTIIGERHTVRNQFLTFLEFYYMRKKQAEEAKENEKEIHGKKKRKEVYDKIRESKKKRIKYLIDEKDKKTIEKLNEIDIEKVEDINKLEITEKIPENNPSGENILEKNDDKITVLSEQEIKTVKKLKRTYKDNAHMYKDYVKNYYDFKGIEKRKLQAEITATRGKQAKEIFMKEMSAISYKLKNTNQSTNPKINKLENLI